MRARRGVDRAASAVSALLPTGKHEGMEQVGGYSPDEHRPLGGYLALIGGYGAAVGTAGWWVRRRGDLPARISLGDIVLLGVAGHKLSRLATKDAVLSPFRAPFTRFAGNAGDGEVEEEVQGTGLRHAIGELLTCPFCFGTWVVTGLTFGLVLAPRATRTVAGAAAALTVSDALQFAYASLQRTEG